MVRPRVEFDMLSKERPDALVASVLVMTSVPLTRVMRLVVLPLMLFVPVPTTTVLAYTVPLVTLSKPLVDPAAQLPTEVRPRYRLVLTLRTAVGPLMFRTPAIGC